MGGNQFPKLGGGWVGTSFPTRRKMGGNQFPKLGGRWVGTSFPNSEEDGWEPVSQTRSRMGGNQNEFDSWSNSQDSCKYDVLSSLIFRLFGSCWLISSHMCLMAILIRRFKCSLKRSHGMFAPGELLVSRV